MCTIDRGNLESDSPYAAACRGQHESVSRGVAGIAGSGSLRAYQLIHESTLKIDAPFLTCPSDVSAMALHSCLVIQSKDSLFDIAYRCLAIACSLSKPKLRGLST